MKKLKILLILAVIISFSIAATGCKKPDDYMKSGDYQKAYDLYMKDAKKYDARLSSKYSTAQLAQAKTDAASLAEVYYKAAEAKDKMGDSTAAEALFFKASKKDFRVTEQYSVSEKVWIPAGYDDLWVPAAYKEVWIDGGYKEVWVDGGYTEVFVEGYYDSNNVFVEGHYEQVKEDGHYNQQYVEGHYDQEYVSGHYEKQYVEAHYEMKTHYETRPYDFVNNGPYVDMAISKMKTPPAETLGTSEVRLSSSSIGNSSQLKAAKDSLDTAYRRWIQAGSKTDGKEHSDYVTAKAAYDNLQKN